MTKEAAGKGPAVIMLVRHAEKPAVSVNGVTYAGKKSADEGLGVARHAKV